MKKLMQSSDKSTCLRAEKTRLGCGICPRISALPLKGCQKNKKEIVSSVRYVFCVVLKWQPVLFSGAIS